MNNAIILLTCQHAVNTVPQEYQTLFKPFDSLLNSHRGIDYGSLDMALYLKKQLSCDLIQATATRLLIDCNRSLNHPNCFSEVTKTLSQETKHQIITTYYEPYRQAVLNRINELINKNHFVINVSVHSFTPTLNEVPRNADIGLLYDPQYGHEKELARQWQLALKQLNPQLKVRMNYPYKGISDGHTSALRKLFSPKQYVGIELEANQKWSLNTSEQTQLNQLIASSLIKIIS